MTALPVVLAAACAAVAAGVPAPSRLDAVARLEERDLRVPWQLAVVPVALVLGPVGTVLLVAVSAVGSRAWARRVRERVRAREVASAGECLAVLAAELRAGRGEADALQAASSVALGGLAQALDAAATGQRFGADAGTALSRSASSTEVPQVLLSLGACWQVCTATGSSLASAVDQLAAALRVEREQRLAVEAELAGPRATAALLAGLPALGLALAAGLGARPVHVLLHTPVGAGCLVVGVLLDLLGLWWTGRLVASASRVR